MMELTRRRRGVAVLEEDVTKVFNTGVRNSSGGGDKGWNKKVLIGAFSLRSL